MSILHTIDIVLNILDMCFVSIFFFGGGGVGSRVTYFMMGCTAIVAVTRYHKGPGGKDWEGGGGKNWQKQHHIFCEWPLSKAAEERDVA